MRTAFRPLAFFFVFLVSLAARGAEDLSRFAGAWRMTQAQMAGKAVPADALKGVTVTVRDTSYQVTNDRDPKAEPLERGTFSLQPDARPREMTLKVTGGPNAGKMALAIYEFEGEKLRVCYDLSGTKTPTEFKSATGTQHYLVTYERVK